MARPSPAQDASLYEVAAHCLSATDVAEKLARTHAAVTAWRRELLPCDGRHATDWRPIGTPGRPARPRLVAPRQLPRRGFHTEAGRAALIHAVTHIEFNAVNLAWDAVQRFPGLPTAYYADWVRVADEEARHFRLLRARLNELGYDYGNFDAHDGLWAMAEDTAHDPLARMALVPRVLEARGLDVTPVMMERFRLAGDEATAAILAVILHDEVGHVAVGTRWFRHLCRERRLDPEATHRTLLDRHMKGGVKGPLNVAARREAGFTEAEIRFLEERIAAGG